MAEQKEKEKVGIVEESDAVRAWRAENAAACRCEGPITLDQLRSCPEHGGAWSYKCPTCNHHSAVFRRDFALEDRIPKERYQEVVEDVQRWLDGR